MDVVGSGVWLVPWFLGSRGARRKTGGCFPGTARSWRGGGIEVRGPRTKGGCVACLRLFLLPNGKGTAFKWYGCVVSNVCGVQCVVSSASGAQRVSFKDCAP